MPERIAYIPLETYPEPVVDSAILSALDLADAIGFGTHVSLFAVDIPPVASPPGRPSARH